MTDDNPNAWIQREREKFWEDVYTAPVWANQDFACRIAYNDPRVVHFVHVSLKDPKLLAYTENADKGKRDIQTQIKPGRYLSKFYSAELTAKQIQFYAQWQLTGRRDSDCGKLELLFADTAEEIVRVYKTGPASCMTWTHTSTSDHPCRVYAAGDLAVAYLQNAAGLPIARCLVWPDKMVAGRIYPTTDRYRENSELYSSMSDAEDAYHALHDKLKAEGYAFTQEGGSFAGAKLAKIETGSHNEYVMPYLDGGYMVNDECDYFTMALNGEYSADNTDGTCVLGDRHEYHCERCEDGCNDVTEVVTSFRSPYNRTEQWCECCAGDHSFYCNGLDNQVSDYLESTEVAGQTYSEHYAQNNFAYCDKTDTWFDTDDGKVDMADGETWCPDAFAEHGFTCAITGENHPNDEKHDLYPQVHEYCDHDQIEEWLAKLETARIDDARQKEVDFVYGHNWTATLERVA